MKKTLVAAFAILLIATGLNAAVTLTTPIPVPNVTRWMISAVNANDDTSIMIVTIEFRSAPATNQLLVRATLQIANVVAGGLTTKIARQTPIVGGNSSDILTFSQLSLPTGYDDAIAAWRSGATPNARKAALETFLLSSGIVDSSLTGT